MTAAQFAAAALLARLSPARTCVAYSVLVDGKTYGQAVEPFGWTRQAAYWPVKSIKAHWTLYEAARDAERNESTAADTVRPLTPLSTKFSQSTGATTMSTPAERRKQFENADAICALEGFTEADKTPEMIRRREAVINGAMSTDEAVAEAIAEAKAKVAKAKSDATP